MNQFKPHNYQKHAYNWILERQAGLLALDMGLGKTVITLSVIAELKYSRFAINKTLIIAPKKVAEATWQNEQKKWEHLKLLRISTVLGSQPKRIKALCEPADIYIINRENVKWLVDYYRNDWPFDTVIGDEFSSFKSSSSQRFKALKSVRPHIKRIYGLTGTPAPNGLIDLWAQIYLLDQGQRLGKFITHFRTRYLEPDKRNQTQIFSYKPKQGSEDSIHQAIEDICLSMKADDYLDLPDLIYNTIPVVLDSKAQKAYRTLEKEMLLNIDETEIDATSAAVLTNKLAQLSNGAVYDADRNVKEIHVCKLEAFSELIEGLGGKSALVFYNFQHDKSRLKDLLSKTKLRIRELKNPQDEADWNAGEIDILLAHPASAAYGLNLQNGGNNVVWFGLNRSLELYEQANKRLHRQGQKDKVFIHHLVVQDGVDVDILNALEGKGEIQGALMEALKARIEKVKELN